MYRVDLEKRGIPHLFVYRILVDERAEIRGSFMAQWFLIVAGGSAMPDKHPSPLCAPDSSNAAETMFTSVFDNPTE